MAGAELDQRRDWGAWAASITASALVLIGAWALSGYVHGSMTPGEPVEMQAPGWLEQLPGELLAWTLMEDGSVVALAAVEEAGQGRVGQFFRAGAAWSEAPGAAAIQLLEGAAYQLQALQGEALVVIRRRAEESGASFSLIRGGAAVGTFATNQPITSINSVQDPANQVDALLLGTAEGQVLLENVIGDGFSEIDAHDVWVRFLHVDTQATPPSITSIAADGTIAEFQLAGGGLDLLGRPRGDAMFRLHDAPGAPRQGVDNLPPGAVFREPGCDACPEMVMIPEGTGLRWARLRWRRRARHGYRRATA